MTGALAGTRVLDIANFFAGPHACMMLADMGADVIKVEQPPRGDPTRNREDDSGYAASFVAKNRNKRSIVLDLKSVAGQDVLRRLVRESDVIVTSMRPQTRDRLGLTYDQIAPVNPRLVYCSITGYGETALATDRPAFDTTAQALSGLLSLITSNFDQPMAIKALLADMLAGHYAAHGIVCALLARERTGRGQEIRTSLLEASIAFADSAFYHVLLAQSLGLPKKQQEMRTAGFLFVAGDGLPFAVHVPPSPEKNWISYTDAMGMPELREDPRFKLKLPRDENYPALHAEISRQVKKHPRTYWLDRLIAHDVPCAPIYGMGEVFHDPLVESLGMLHTVRDPWGQDRQVVGAGLRLSDSTVERPSRAPLMGEHTREILAALKYSSAEVDALEIQRAVISSAEAKDRPA
ncbi:MAG: CoA transferase [Alphaproteobacteria bacterium]|nr:CoA transferase [Alphaproteobacteria bacterium]